MREQKQNEITISLKLQGIDEVTEKLEGYVKLLKEAKTLAGELASMDKKQELTNIVRGNRNESIEERLRAVAELLTLSE